MATDTDTSIGAIKDETTSEQLSTPLQESESVNKSQDFIVTNIDQGNLAAGTLLKNLIQEIKTYSSQLSTLSNRLDDYVKRLESLEKNQSSFDDEKVIRKVSEEFRELIKMEQKEQTQQSDALKKRMCSLERTHSDDCHEIKEEMVKLIEQKLVEQRTTMEQEFEKKLADQKRIIKEETTFLTRDKPTGATPTGAIPTGATPTGDTPTGDTPTGATPTGDTPNEKSTNNTDDDLMKQLSDLLSKLYDLSDSVAPNARRPSQCRRSYSRNVSTSDSFDDVSSPVIPRSNSTSSSGRGTLSKRGSDLSMIDESISFLPTNEDRIMSTPKTESNSKIGNVIFSMTDFVESLKELVPSAPTSQ